MGARRPHTEPYDHLVWATWDRQPWINAEVEARIYGALRHKLAELGCSEVTINGMADHVHILCRIPPTLPLSHVIQRAKGASSHFATHELLDCAEFKWQGGYGAFTVSPREVPSVRNYILR
jgi:REP element-mobilizing transposase RayT